MKKILAILCIGLGMATYAQEFEVSAELRPRFEYRHGYKTLAVDSINAAAFVSQRTRLNFGYKSEKLNAYFSLQNVRVWGDVPTLSDSDVNGTAIHEAWAEVLLNNQFSLKFGRQEIVYDDQRMFGNVGWAQQARSHDALIVTFKPNKNNRIDLGLALSAESESLAEIDYNVNNYKSFQYLWYHTRLSDIGLSFLILNNGLAYYDLDSEQQVDYNQTFGTHASYAKSKLKADASAYFQTGKIANTDLSAFNFALNAYYDITDNFNIGLGGEYLSGTDMNTTSNKLESFNPWYGTNHKFNGWMDYFYVGSHSASVGLLDLNATIAYQKNKFTAKLMPHFFSSAATIINGSGEELSNTLGTEIDLTLGYNFSKDIQFQVGYSQMFATESMEVLKGGDKDATNNWAWAMIVVKPTLFKTNFKKEVTE
ncbi:alginate export family protein [Xanthomarina sp. F2636L]|uniref:alginate export family protein n=1 Tax=Xanthomarina sp. F2636L TaxID=2996018 RepID=UPI00225E46CC|nr:alginate export family protein [Xanthomarina sp. F2636L]MCX7550043.1 alginate export family protein [Xanthomarina sp. F2636L]